MKNKLRMATFWLVVGTVCIGRVQGLWAQSSNTGCGYFSPGQKAVPTLKPAAFHPGADQANASIVGLWRFSFISEGNPGIPDAP